MPKNNSSAFQRSSARRSGRKRKLTLATLALGSIGGVAFAFWTATGVGEGTASTADVQSVTLTQTSTVDGLAPGADPQTLSGTFTNPNDTPVYVHDVSATITGTDKTGCTAADYTITGPAFVDSQIITGDTWGDAADLTIAFNNSATVNQDACKGATLTIAYTANAN